jgi:hypothetical protein
MEEPRSVDGTPFLVSSIPGFLRSSCRAGGRTNPTRRQGFRAVTRSWGSVSRGLRKNCIGE